MYLRRVRVRKGRKWYDYWALVRSVREGRTVRQQTVAYLGDLNVKDRLKARDLARRITGRDQPGQLDLFEEPLDETVEVLLKGVSLERCRGFGNVWLGCLLWNALKFDEFFEHVMPQGCEDIAWARMAAVLAIARLCNPSSELHIAEQWFRKTALGDLLNIPDEKINDDRLYRSLDQLLPHKDALEVHLKNRFGEMFAPAYDILLYDMTSTYFEGQVNGNELAQRGYSRDHRPDCKQVNIALVVTREGLPLAHEVFAGNTADVKTVKTIVEKIESKFGRSERVWVMDRGMVSAEILKWLRAEKRSYIVGTPKCDLKNFESVLLEGRDWEEVRDGVEVKRCPSPDGIETFMLCRSAARREKECAMRERFEKRIEEGLQKLQRRLVTAKKPLDDAKLHMQIGRLLQRNTRGAGKYKIELVKDTASLGGFSLRYERNAEWSEWHKLADGCYLLRANGLEWTPKELWQAYIQLTDAEEAFKIHKTELEIRPVYHHLADRTRAHIFVCFLAYAMWKTLEQWSDRAGLGRSTGKLLDEFRAVQSADVVLPTSDGRQMRLRCVTQPEKALQTLIQRLGLTIPKRLKLPAMIEALATKM